MQEQGNALLRRCHDALKSAGLDVRLANVPGGKCTSPYVAVYEGAEEPAGKMRVYRHIMVDVLVPKDKPAQLSCQMATVRTAMIDAGLSLAYASQASALEDYEALSISADFRALCAR